MGIKWNDGEYRDFLRYLEKALKDQEIIEILRSVITFDPPNENREEKNYLDENSKKTQSEFIKLEIEQLQEKLKTVKLNEEKALAKLEQANHELARGKEYNNQLNQQFQTMEGEMLELRKENELLKSNYHELASSFEQGLKVFHTYQCLSSELKSSLSGIFRGETVEHFLFCGVQKPNIELLWDAIKIRVVDENYEQLEELQQIFTYFLNAYNSIFEKPLYELQTVDTNERFDHELHIRTNKSRVSGKIEHVLLKGYWNKNNRKIERKSIVKL